MSRADELARLYDGFYADQDQPRRINPIYDYPAYRQEVERRRNEPQPLRYAEQDPPRFLNSPPVQDGPDRTSPLEAVAGFAVLGLVFVLIFWGIA